MRTAVIFTSTYLEHATGRNHPESPARLRAINEELEKSRLLETPRCVIVEPQPARTEDLQLVHEPDYIDIVRRICKSGGGLLDLGDTVASSRSFEVARLAVGGAIDAVRLVATREFQNAFALVRPPGHHAGRNYALGFCIFNNAAIAARYLIRRLRHRRVLILDIDAHHGNGTQEIFYDTDNVLYLGLHQDPRGFPGTGFTDEMGEKTGQGYTVNIPFPFRTSDEAYLKAFEQVVMPITHQYQPDFMLVSAGLDGYYADPVGSLSLSTRLYPKVFSKLRNISSQLCNGKLVAILEGGYNLEVLGTLACSVISELAGVPYAIKMRDSRRSWAKVAREAERVIDEVKHVQSSFWRV